MHVSCHYEHSIWEIREEIWVVTGPIFGESCVELESDIRVPEAFYKIVVAKTGDSVEMLGIIMSNERTEKSSIRQFVHSIDEIEDLAGLDFFKDLIDGVEDAAEAKKEPHSKWSVGWELRPTFAGTERTIRMRECD